MKTKITLLFILVAFISGSSVFAQTVTVTKAPNASNICVGGAPKNIGNIVLTGCTSGGTCNDLWGSSNNSYTIILSISRTDLFRIVGVDSVRRTGGTRVNPANLTSFNDSTITITYTRVSGGGNPGEITIYGTRIRALGVGLDTLKRTGGTSGAAGITVGTSFADLSAVNTAFDDPVVNDSIIQRCGAGTVTITPAGGGTTYRFYRDSTTFTTLAQNTSFTTGSLAVGTDTSFFVSSVTGGGCESALRKRVRIIVGLAPANVTVANQQRCGPGDLTFTPSAPAGPNIVYRFYADSSSTDTLFTGNAYTVNISSTTSYFVRAENTVTGCNSPAFIRVTGTINPFPLNAVTANQERCGTGTVTFVPTPVAGVNFRYYGDSLGASLIATGANYTTASLTNDSSYFVLAFITATTCEAPARVRVRAIINPEPVNTTVSGVSRCGTGTVTITPTGPGGANITYRFYSAASGGTLWGEGASFTTPSLAADINYFVSTYNTVTTCESSRTLASVTINPIPPAPTVAAVERCGPGTVTITPTSGGSNYIYYTAPSGGTALDTATSYTTGVLSSDTTYYVSSLTAASCVSNSRTPVLVTIRSIPPSVSFGLPPSFCFGNPSVTLTGFPAPGGGNTGVFSKTGAGTLIDSLNGKALFIPEQPPGPATVTYTYVVSGQCPSITSQATTVSDTPDVTITSPSLSTFALSQPSVPLVGNPSGGVFSGPGVSGNNFYPNIAGLGTHDIVYSFTNAGGCNKTAIKQVTVDNSVPEQILGVSVNNCREDNSNKVIILNNANNGPFPSFYQRVGYRKRNISGSIDLFDTAGITTIFGTDTGSYNPALINPPCGPGACAQFVVSLVYVGIDPGFPPFIPATLVLWSEQPFNVIYPPQVPAIDTLFNYCIGTPIANFTPSSPFDVRWFSTPGTGSGITVPNPKNVSIAALAPAFDTLSQGTVTRYVRADLSGCLSPAMPVRLALNAIPANPTVTQPPAICQNNPAQTVTTPSAGTISWYPTNVLDPSAKIISNPFSPPVSWMNTATAGTNTFYVTSSQLGCEGPPTTVNFVVNQRFTLSASGTNLVLGAVCEGSNINLTSAINNNPGGVNRVWKRFGTGLFDNNADTSTSVTPAYIPSLLDIENGFVSLRVSTNTPNACPADSVTLNININPAAVVNAGLDDSICATNSPLVLSGFCAKSNGELLNGTWSGGTGSIQAPTSLNTTYILSNADSVNGSIINFILTSNDPDGAGPCPVGRDTVRKKINAFAFIDAGPNFNYCANQTIQLNGIISHPNTSLGGTWSGGNGNFTNGATATPIYNLDTTEKVGFGTPVTLFYTTNDPDSTGPCTPRKDSVTLFIFETPRPNAGPDIVVCASQSIQLTGSNGGYVSGQVWSGGAPGTFANNTSTTPIYFPDPSQIQNGDTVNLIMSSVNLPGPCAIQMDAMVLRINPSFTVSAGNDQRVCSNTTVNLAASTSIAGGTLGGSWRSQGDKGSFANEEALITTYSIDPLDTAGFNNQLFLVFETLDPDGPGPCVSQSDTLILTVDQAPRAYLPADFTICGGTNAPITVTVDGTNATGGTWSDNGGGTFLPNATSFPSVSYRPSPTDSTFGSPAREIYYTTNVTSLAPCLPGRDTVVIKINPAFGVNAGNDIYVCASPNVPVAATINSVTPNIGGQWSGGAGTFTPTPTTPPNPLAFSYHPTIAERDSIGKLITLYFTTNDPDSTGPCVPKTDSLILKIDKQPTAAYTGTIDTICGGAPFPVAGTVTLPAMLGYWSLISGGSGNLGSTSFGPNPTAFYEPSTTDITLGANVTFLLTSDTSAAKGGVCPAATAIKTIRVSQESNVNLSTLGNVAYFCVNDPNIRVIASLTGLVAGSGTRGIWVTNGEGSIPDSTNLNVRYVPSSAEITSINSQNIQFWFISIDPDSTSSGNGPCGPVVSNITVELKPVPVNVIGISKDTVCLDGSRLTLSPTPAVGSQILFSGSNVATGGTTGFEFVPNLDNDQPGNKTVTFTYKDGFGCGKDTTRVIRVDPLPLAGFSFSPLCQDKPIQFTDTSKVLQNVFQDSINQWLWTPEVGGMQDSAQNPLFNYTVPGLKQVTLFVSTNKGCTDTENRTLTVGTNPKADFDWDYICDGDSTKFYDKTSNVSALGSGVESRRWEFLDVVPGFVPIGDSVEKFAFSSNGIFSVRLLVRNVSFCEDSINKTVNILPYLGPSYSDPYLATFDTSTMGWFAQSGTSQPSTWTYGSPTAKVYIRDSLNNFWYTGDPEYNSDERSWVNSPCFNFNSGPDSLFRPMILFKYSSMMPSGVTGAILQLSVDSGRTWSRVGELQSGVEWYRNSNIEGLPLAFSSSQIGFSGTDSGLWRVARHEIDQWNKREKVRFRVYFGSGASQNRNEGFAFDSVWIGDRTRNVLVEQFTNWNDTIDATVKNSERGMKIVVNQRQYDALGLIYHTSVPSPDQLFNEHPGGQSTRALYYGVSNSSARFLDGKNISGLNFSGKDIGLRALLDPEMDINIEELPVSGTDSILVRVTLYPKINSTGRSLILQLGAVERFRTIPIPLLDTAEWFLKALIPDPAGTFLNRTWTIGQSAQFEYVWLPPASFSNAGYIVFLQDNQTKEVLQAKGYNIGGPTVVGIPEIVLKESGIALYPNPAEDMAHVVFALPLEKTVTYTVHDQWGNTVISGEVRQGNDRFEINTSGYASGMYFIRIDGLGAGGKNTVTRKLLVTH